MKKSPQPSRFPSWRRLGLSMLAALGLVSAGSSAGLRAASGVWEPVAQDALGRAPDQTVVEQRYRVFRLNADSLLDILQRAPLESTETAAREAAPVVLELPLPDGTLSRFRIEESPILEPALQAQFPEIRTYHGKGIDDTTALTRFDMTPAGFHAIVFTAQGTVYVDPHTKGDPSYYVAYNKKDYRREGVEPFRCLVHGRPAGSGERPVVGAAPPLDTPFGTTLRTYRAAVAATGEYTAFQGGTVNAALSAITTTMNRVTGIYERELAVRMTLIANETAIIYTNGATDPYTNNDGVAMLGENQTNLTNVIGAANYDIGHVFSTGGGGVASLGVICANTLKARGVTGSPSPIGDPFDVDYVAHEMGHQFAGNHTFNGTTGSCGGGNRNAGTAFEPGSGSTIMAYAGICGAEDLQSNSDDIFHAGSLDEIRTFVGGTACDVESATSNTPPTANAGADFTIPRSTPFTLTGSATDANGDTLTYAWEEMDLGAAAPPNTDDGTRALFRSFDPTTSPSRTFPKLANILNNTTTIGESLPTTTRSMKFRMTVRDNRLNGGGTNFDEMFLNVRADSGPFTVTAPNTAITWAGGSTQSVTWNVANTNLAPVSTANVKISLSTDGGNTFPTVLLASTPNDGSQTVTVPNVSSTTARVKVEAVGNVYFDVSNVNFTITAGGATPTVTVSTTTATPNQAVTVTVANGPGVANDWVGLFPVGAAQNAYLTWKYLNNSQTLPATGVTGATLNFNMPATNGNYEFRLISGGTLRATSATVVVSGTSTATVTPSTTTATPGQAITVTVAGAPGVASDWVGLFAVGAAQNAYLSWKYMNNTQTLPATGITAATLNFTMPTTNGNYEFRLISGGTLRATSATVVVSGTSTTTVTPSTTTATPGQAITVTVAGGPGVASDWVGLFAVGAAQNAYLSWKYMNNTQTLPATGITAATLNFTMPTTNGNYEFRFISGGTLRATSATVVVSGTSTTTVTPSTTTATPNQAITVTVAGGPGVASDWVGLFPVGAAQTGYLSWKYMNNTQTLPASGITAATLNFTMPASNGNYEFRLISGGTLRATSATVVVSGGSTPTVTPSTTTAVPSQAITVTVANGPGVASDWVGLFPVGAAQTGYLSWKYMNNTQTLPASGITAATLNFTMPASNGNYHFRLISGGTLRATSATVVVQGAGGTDSDGDRLPDSAETNTGVFVNSSNTGTNPNNPDTDGDGIKDGDEVLGTLAGLNLPAMGANPLKKDLFLEYDWFDDNSEPLQCGAHSHRPTQAMLNKVTAAFAAAPNTNPDGSTGIVMHHDFGQGGAFTGGNLAADADGALVGGVNDAEFQQRKTANFASNRSGYFHYVLMPHVYDIGGPGEGSSGQAELPGDDLVVSLQCFNSLDNVANTIMHELGHNLNLRHGGFENCNWKPNFNSVMNYRFQFPGVDTSCNALGNNGEANVLDYSRGTRINLNENNLNESQGTCGSTAIDWNFSSTIQSGIAYDLNRNSATPNAMTGVDNSACTANFMVLQDSNDWAAVVFSGLTDADRGITPEIVSCDNPAPPILPEP